MHRTGRIGRDIFDIDRPLPDSQRMAVIFALLDHGMQHIFKHMRGKAEIDEARSGNRDRHHIGIILQQSHQSFGQFARRHSGFLGQHHRGIGGQIAMRGIARRLDHHPRQIQPLRQYALFGQLFDGEPQTMFENFKNIHDSALALYGAGFDRKTLMRKSGWINKDRCARPSVNRAKRQTSGGVRAGQNGRSCLRYNRQCGGRVVGLSGFPAPRPIHRAIRTAF